MALGLLASAQAAVAGAPAISQAAAAFSLRKGITAEFAEFAEVVDACWRPVLGKEAADPCGGRDPRRRTWPAPLPPLRRGAGWATASNRGDEQA